MARHDRSEEVENAILEHLHSVSLVKRAILSAVKDIKDEYPVQAVLLLDAAKELTRSADRLLGDTLVT